MRKIKPIGHRDTTKGREPTTYQVTDDRGNCLATLARMSDGRYHAAGRTVATLAAALRLVGIDRTKGPKGKAANFHINSATINGDTNHDNGQRVFGMFTNHKPEPPFEITP